MPTPLDRDDAPAWSALPPQSRTARCTWAPTSCTHSTLPAQRTAPEHRRAATRCGRPPRLPAGSAPRRRSAGESCTSAPRTTTCTCTTRREVPVVAEPPRRAHPPAALQRTMAALSTPRQPLRTGVSTWVRPTARCTRTRLRRDAAYGARAQLDGVVTRSRFRNVGLARSAESSAQPTTRARPGPTGRSRPPWRSSAFLTDL